MHKFTLSVPCPHHGDEQMTDFAVMIELARECAHALDRVVYISMEGAGLGCPDRWAVSPRGYLSVEGVKMPMCVGCGDN